VKRLLGAAILSALATTGCLTGGLMEEVHAPSRHVRTIVSVIRAAVDGDRVILQLGAQWPDRAYAEIIEAEIPLDDLEWATKNAVEGRPQVPGLIFARPTKRAVSRSSPGPLKGTPIEVEPFDLKGREHLATVGDGLAPGIHVLSLDNFPEPGRRPHTVAAVLDLREGREPTGIVIADLPDARTHRQFLVLLLPVTVAIDAVTFPIQMVLGVLIGGC